MTLKKGDRMPERKSTALYTQLSREKTVAIPYRLGLTLDAVDLDLMGKIQAKRFKDTARIPGPTTLLREGLRALAKAERV